MRFLPLSALSLALLTTSPSLALPTTTLSFIPGALSATQAYGVTRPARIEAVPDAPHGHVQDSYMVVLKKGIDASTFLAHTQLINQVATLSAFKSNSQKEEGIRHVYNLPSALQGYAGTFAPDVVAYIRSLPEVEYLERDTVVKTTVMQNDGSMVWDVDYDLPRYSGVKVAGASDPHEVEKSAPWGLARISHREKLGFGNFNKYVYEQHAGEGVTAYIIDTGIYVNHTDFEGRARWGKTMPQNDVDADGNGHGTHCAGTIGSKTYGVAKKAELVAVKVLGSGGSGTMSDVTAGVLWAVEDAKKISAKHMANPSSAAAKKHKGFVANMSLGGGKSPTLDIAVNGAVDNGLHFAVAAGNENNDACGTSPAGAKNPITIGASTIGDERAYFSNWGKCVDVFAPGLNIKSTWNTGKDSVNTISGTSMATPHIVGMLAYFLSIYGTDDFVEIKDAIPMPKFGEQSISAAQQGLLNSLARGAHAVLKTLPLPGLVLDFIADTFLTEDAASAMKGSEKGPDVVSVLHPNDMKKAFTKFATKGLLTDLDSASPNLLAFNNATSPTDKH